MKMTCLSLGDIMASFSLWHWIIAFVWIAITAIPISRIIRKAGFSGWWTIAAYVPLLNLIMLWVLAIKDWRPSRL